MLDLFEQECPSCSQDYAGLSIESSRELEFSRIVCSECKWSFSDNCCEEDLIEKFIERY